MLEPPKLPPLRQNIHQQKLGDIGKSQHDRAVVLQRREAIADMYIRGLSMRAIGEKTSLSVGAVAENIRWIEKEWYKATINSRDRWLAEEIARINKIEAEAWEAWEKSKKDKTTRRVKTGAKGEFKEITTESAAGDTSYLAVVEWCVDKRCKLRGLESTRVELTGANGGPLVVQETPKPGDDALLELAQMLKEARTRSEGQLKEMRMLPSAGLEPGDVPDEAIFEEPVEIDEPPPDEVKS